MFLQYIVCSVVVVVVEATLIMCLINTFKNACLNLEFCDV